MHHQHESVILQLFNSEEILEDERILSPRRMDLIYANSRVLDLRIPFESKAWEERCNLKYKLSQLLFVERSKQEHYKLQINSQSISLFDEILLKMRDSEISIKITHFAGPRFWLLIYQKDSEQRQVELTFSVKDLARYFDLTFGSDFRVLLTVHPKP